MPTTANEMTAGLPFSNSWIAPDYNNSIANVPATVANLLGASFDGLPPLKLHIDGDVRRVVVVVLDALGWNIFERLQSPLIERATAVHQLTSVLPSTTTAALTSLWTGSAPAQHGLLGLFLFFPEYAVIGQMLSLSPSIVRAPDALVHAGLDPTSFLAIQTLGRQFDSAGIKSYAFKQSSIVDSTLSKMHGDGLSGSVGVVTLSDMLVEARRLIESQLDERLFIQLYWPTIDTLSHRYGPLSDAVLAESELLLHQIDTQFVQQLPAAAREGTLLLLMADHGQLTVERDDYIFLSDHPQLNEMLLMRPSGDPRCTYLYVRQGAVNDVVDYVNQELQDEAFALPAEQALQRGLFGPLPHAPATRRRVGDVVVLLKDKLLVPVSSNEEKLLLRFRGMHGGLTAAEMHVPLLYWDQL